MQSLDLANPNPARAAHPLPRAAAARVGPVEFKSAAALHFCIYLCTEAHTRAVTECHKPEKTQGKHTDTQACSLSQRTQHTRTADTCCGVAPSSKLAGSVHSFKMGPLKASNGLLYSPNLGVAWLPKTGGVAEVLGVGLGGVAGVLVEAGDCRAAAAGKSRQ